MHRGEKICVRIKGFLCEETSFLWVLRLKNEGLRHHIQ